MEYCSITAGIGGVLAGCAQAGERGARRAFRCARCGPIRVPRLPGPASPAAARRVPRCCTVVIHLHTAVHRLWATVCDCRRHHRRCWRFALTGQAARRVPVPRPRGLRLPPPRVGLCDGVTAQVNPRSLCDGRRSSRDESCADFGRPGDVAYLVTPRAVRHSGPRQSEAGWPGKPCGSQGWHESTLPSRQPGRGKVCRRCAQGLWINCAKYARMAMPCQGTRLEKQ